MNIKLTFVAIAVASCMPAHAADSLLDAFMQGKTSLDTRLRFDYISDDSKPVETEGQAFTNRLVLGYKTADFMGFTSGIEFENVSALIDDEHYNSGPPAGAIGAGNGNTTYPSISDPYLTQVNQAWIDYKGLKYGRQKVVFDNARFVGDAGWRQNDQTFDGLSYANKTLIPKSQFSLAYLTRVHNIFGATRTVAAPMLNFKFNANATNAIAAFYYAVDEDSAPAASWDHTGLRADGTFGGLIYDLSWATQGSYKDGTTVDADYMDVQAGYKFSLLTVKAQYEVLDAGFKTPLATLHAFNGWADRFLATPVAGLEDMNIKIVAPAWGNNITFAWHQFSVHETSMDFGQELNLSVVRKFSDKMTGLVKYASYMGEAGAPAALSKDVSKFWLQVQYKFL